MELDSKSTVALGEGKQPSFSLGIELTVEMAKGKKGKCEGILKVLM